MVYNILEIGNWVLEILIQMNNLQLAINHLLLQIFGKFDIL